MPERHPPRRPRRPALGAAVAAILAALAGSCDGQGIPAGESRTWTGWERYRFGTGATVDDLNCDLRWTVTGTEASARCPACTFAFDIAGVLDEDASLNDGSCLDAGDFERTLGFVADWEGAGPMVGRVENGTFYPEASATWDEAAGTLSWASGNLGYEAYAYYTVDYREGYGRIGDASRATDAPGTSTR